MQSRTITPRAGGQFRWWMVFAAIFLLLILLTAAIYAARKPIAGFVVQSYLLRYGITSAVEFDRLARGGFVARVHIGPETPEFSAEILDVTLSYDNFLGWPTVGMVRLVRPVLRASFDGKKFNFGSLQPLVDAALKEPPAPPGPSVTVENGTFFLSTPEGEIQAAVNMTINHGRLDKLTATLSPGVLRSGLYAIELADATITAATVNDTVNGKLSFRMKSVSGKAIELSGITGSLDLQALRWNRTDAFTEIALESGVVRINADGLTTGDTRFEGDAIAASADFRALAWKTGDSARFALGRATVAINSAAFSGATFSVSQSDTHIALQNLQGSYADSQLRVKGGIDLTSKFTAFKADENSAAKFAMHATSQNAAMELSGQHWFAGGPMQMSFEGTNARYHVKSGDVAIRSAAGSFAGNGVVSDETREGALQGSLTLRGNLPPETARMLVGSLPLPNTDPPIADGLVNAARDLAFQMPRLSVAYSDKESTIALSAPAVVAGAGGARLTISPQAGPLLRMTSTGTDGGFAVQLRGGQLPQTDLIVSRYRLQDAPGGRVWNAVTQFDTRLSLPSLRGLHVSGSGQWDGRGNRVSMGLAQCIEVSFDAFVSRGVTEVGDATGRLCAETARAVLIADKPGWSVSGAWNSVSAHFPQAQSVVANANGRVELAGDGAGLKTGHLAVVRGRLSDLQPAARFMPLDVAGDLNLADNIWQGPFALTARERPFAAVAVRHDMNTGAGTARITASDVSFDPALFQPADISPLLASFGTRIRGRANFAGEVNWTPQAVLSNGRVQLTNVDLQTRFGGVRGTSGEIILNSLLPPVVAPHQSLAVQRIDWLLPIEQAKLQFTVTPMEIQLESASGNVAGGQASLDPQVISLAPGSTTKGILHLQHIDLAPLIAAAGLANKVAIAGRIGGDIPFTSGPAGLRFASGQIAAEAPGRLSIKREALVAAVGTGGGAQAPPGAVQDFAYQALENLSFNALTGTVNSLPMGRLGVLLHVKGEHDPPQAQETRVGILDLLQGRAFEKPLPLPKATPIDLTLDTSLNLDELLASYYGAGNSMTAPTR